MTRHVTTMTIDDVDHYTPEQRAEIISSYLPHEREARTRGIPMMGSGRIFPIEEAAITVQPREIPKHWRQIVGTDFGWDHPFGAVNLAHDLDADCLYVTHTYRARETTPVIHSASIKAWGDWKPVAWPHDGLQHDKGSGLQLAEQYRKHGLKMLPEHSTHPEGGFGVEAGLVEMLERMQTNRFKVFAGLGDWFEEFRLYHRDDGKIVKLYDDLMSATRVGLMMLRFAITKPVPVNLNLQMLHKGLA